ncbi:MAG TPA: hypothetical protein VMZ00_02045 [Sporichthya sp.]|nr:hypothetical protein [Sporichthya sp.]
MGQSISGVEALVILIACTTAILAFTYMWGAANMRPVRRRVVSGRPADPYWHTPSGLQDERGITAVEPAPRLESRFE